MFEMLGNWSFGDYFKEQAVTMAWECLTIEFGLNPDRLYATYFGGDEKKAKGVPSDEETRQLWLRFLPPERVLPFDAADNFWEMGDVGPCGPCTEIHYDRLGGRDAASLVNEDDPNVIEIWNNVFIQYNRHADGLDSLPAQHVDTGMGFERLASILQDKLSNYDTDVFMPIFAAIQRATGAPPYTGLVGEADADTKDMAYRVVADHIRTLSFAITDGAVPDNMGRGYVLRRILRRAVWYGKTFLGAPPGFFHTLVPVVIEQLAYFFPELGKKQAHVMAVLKGEEEDFLKTLDKGVRHFNKVAKKLSESGVKVVPGAEAWFLSSSLGFPLDLTQIMAEEQGLTVDEEGYNAARQAEKDHNDEALASRKATTAKDMTFEADQTSQLQKDGVAPTDYQNKYVWHHEPSAVVKAVFAGRAATEDGKGFVPSAGAADGVVALVLDTTSFYAEAGGQIFDTGLLTSPCGAKSLRVDQCTTHGGFVLHTGVVENGTIAVGDKLNCMVDYARRGYVAPNHTMTHALNYALREVLLGSGERGSAKVDPAEDKVNQKGSSCDHERLRFDFSWDKPVTPAQLGRVEAIVQELIDEKLDVFASVEPLEAARTIHGLRIVQGERYPDPVRILSIGADIAKMLDDPKSAEWAKYSVEFCGGTHITKTSDAETFALLEESGVAKGIRRITAVTREKAREAIAEGEALAERVGRTEALAGQPAELEKALKVLATDLDKAVAPAAVKHALRSRVEALQKTLLELKKKASKEAEAAALKDAKALAGGAARGALVASRIDFGSDGKLASKLGKEMEKANKDASFALFTADEAAGKFSVFVFVCKGHQDEGLDATKLVAAVLQVCGGGKSGGRAAGANGTVESLAQLDAAIAAAKAFTWK